VKILSLGWGVQSFTLAAMVALGELEPIDCALHADTLHEFSGTYAFAKRWSLWLIERGVNVATTSNSENKVIPGGRGGISIPAFLFSRRKKGQIHRQCTGHWKIEVMRRWLQANRNGELIEQWIGISTDEALRMKPSNVKYITHRWPLIENGMSRRDCVIWLQGHGLEIPPKSACVFCPFHSNAEWQQIKNESNEDWDKAIEIDTVIRKAYPPYDLFIHPSRKPLALVDLRTQEQKGQMRLWDEECTGICGV
jgi:hypothetical protein